MSCALFNKAKQETPKFNDRVVEGLAKKELEGAKRYIGSIFNIASVGWPEGLKFVGLEDCTPREEFEFISGGRASSGQRRTYDRARTDSYLLKYRLEWQGELLPPKYLSIPHVGEAGTMHLRGPMYTVSPVLADPILSVSKESVFIPFLRDRVTFYRLLGEYRKQGLNKKAYIVWSKLHGYAPGAEKITAPKTTMAHYLFCKHGFEGTFKEEVGAEIHVGYEDINTTNYPESEGWSIYSSAGVTPKALRRDYSYRKSEIRVAMQDSFENDLTRSLMAAFFYITDFFPDRVVPGQTNDTDLWKILLGSLLDYSDRNEGRLLLDVETHITSLDHYVDEIVKGDLRKAKRPIWSENIYELFVYITKYISLFLMHTELSNMYDKRLMVNRYVLLDFTKAIFNFTYRLNGNAKKEITLKDINQVAGKYLNTSIIYNLTKTHGEVNVISSPGDCYLFKHTGKMVLQVDATSRRNRNKKSINCPTRHLNASLAEVGNYRFLTKPQPDGSSHVNPRVRLNPDLSIKRNPALKDKIDTTQELVKRR